MAPRFITPARPESKAIIAPGRRKAARFQAAGLERGVQALLRDLVRPFARIVLAGLDREAHLLGEVSTDEPPDGVVFMPMSA
jgi:hypothetical protein